MFIDKTKIYIKAGDGGDGCASFFTEKFLIKGGPDGGDGGKGGDVIFVVDKDMSSLIDFRHGARYKAQNGAKGASRFCTGKGGEDLVIKLPLGTVVRDAETDGLIADLATATSRVVVLKGGWGGKGNARFKSSRRRAPSFAQSGEKTIERCVKLELKIIADIGLVGFPNVGKSTLLSRISAAKPKIANYHFTTLSPSIGVVRYHNHSFAVADIPGIIEGASQGAGLGLDFLRHIERTRILVHVIDIAGTEGRDPVADYHKINNELIAYSDKVASYPQLIVLNKADALGGDRSPIERFEQAVGGKKLVISGATGEGIEQLIAQLYEMLVALPPREEEADELFVYPERDKTQFEVMRDSDGSFVIMGGLVDELNRNVVPDSYESLAYLQKQLKEHGVIKALRKIGLTSGCTIRILETEFEYTE